MFRVTMKGDTYIFTFMGAENGSQGFKVVCTTRPQDRLSRRYFVYTDKAKMPLRCNCPSHVEAGRYCKHMEAVRDWQSISA